MLTAGFSPQIICCKTLSFGNTSSQIKADGKGGAAGAHAAAAGAGAGGWSSTANTTAYTDPPGAAQPISWLDNLMASGAAGSVGGNTTSPAGGSGTASGAFSPLLGSLIAEILTWVGINKLVGGGGGGAGGASSSGTAGTAGSGGVRGGKGSAGSNNAGGGGGSGIGGGGGGGGGDTAIGGGNGGDGGIGGGILIVFCDSITTAAGIISADGAVGSTGGASGGGGGGGGGGGISMVFARTTSVTPTVRANGGTGGASGGGNGRAGGPGGAGLAFLQVG